MIYTPRYLLFHIYFICPNHTSLIWFHCAKRTQINPLCIYLIPAAHLRSLRLSNHLNPYRKTPSSSKHDKNKAAFPSLGDKVSGRRRGHPEVSRPAAGTADHAHAIVGYTYQRLRLRSTLALNWSVSDETFDICTWLSVITSTAN